MSKCGKGKPCGESCISKGIKCRKSLSEKDSKNFSKISALLEPSYPGLRFDRRAAEEFDQELLGEKLRREGDKSFDRWGESSLKGSRSMRGGSQGEISILPDGTFIKRGDLSDEEAKIMNIVGRKDLGPRLIAADFDGEVRDPTGTFTLTMRRGRIAMTRVSGKPLEDGDPAQKINGNPVADIYWKAMADLHRLGIAHNDAHPDNLFIDSSGKARWVDFGLSQKNPKAALAEVMGVFQNIRPKPNYPSDGFWDGSGKMGNWQTQNWEATGVERARRAYSNIESPEKFREDFPITSKIFEKWRYGTLQGRLKKMGLTQLEIFEMCHHGIRSSAESYKRGGWRKLSNKQAQEIIDFIYEGI